MPHVTHRETIVEPPNEVVKWMKMVSPAVYAPSPGGGESKTKSSVHDNDGESRARVSESMYV